MPSVGLPYNALLLSDKQKCVQYFNTGHGTTGVLLCPVLMRIKGLLLFSLSTLPTRQWLTPHCPQGQTELSLPPLPQYRDDAKAVTNLSEPDTETRI